MPKQYYAALLNDEWAFSVGLHALGHAAFGIAHRIPEGKMPVINVFLAPSDVLAEFKQAAKQWALAHSDSTILSNILDPMTTGEHTTEERLQRVKETKAADLENLLAGLLTDKDLSELPEFKDILRKCKQLEHYDPYEGSDEEHDFLLRSDLPVAPRNEAASRQLIIQAFQGDTQDHALPNAIVRASIRLGAKLGFEYSGLVTYQDKEGHTYPPVSSHDYKILSVSELDRYTRLGESLSADTSVRSETIFRADGVSPLVFYAFGNENQVKTYVSDLPIWRRVLPETPDVSEGSDAGNVSDEEPEFKGFGDDDQDALKAINELTRVLLAEKRDAAPPTATLPGPQ